MTALRNGHWGEARRLASRAVLELRRAQRRNDRDAAREAAGKGWLAACEALDGLIVSRGVADEQLPRTQRARWYYLGRFGDREFRKLFHSLYGGLHMAAYYEGIVEWVALRENFRDLRELIHQAHALGDHRS